MLASLRKGRDSIRKNDISAVENALDTYYQKYKIYPDSTSDGKIVGCFEFGSVINEESGYPENATICEWGKSKFEGNRIVPIDPDYEKGVNYYYESDGQSFVFYIALEGKNEPEYTESISRKNLQCGVRICNYGRGANAIKN